MAKSAPKLLVVDDIALNRKLLSSFLSRAGYESFAVEGGAEALEELERHPREYRAVLLDRMMPGLDGLEVLARMKGHRELQYLPVILQTAMVAPEEILEGLRAGAYYYLTKPVERETLLAVVDTAVRDHEQFVELHQKVAQTSGALSMLRHGRFRCRSPEECRDLATFLANACPVPEKSVIGLAELLLNGVEHGNLGITYAEKSEFQASEAFDAEVARRLELPANRQKRVEVTFEREDDQLRFTIRDEGEGFDWESYLDVDPTRILDTHGRGIAMAKLVSFDDLRYEPPGNVVIAELVTVEVSPAVG